MSDPAPPPKPSIPERPGGIKPTIPARPSSGTLTASGGPKPKPSIPARPVIPARPIEKKAQDFSIDGESSSSSNLPIPTTQEPSVSEPKEKAPVPSPADGEASADGEAEEAPRTESVTEKRGKIVNEVLSTEEYYVKCLDFMVLRYMHPLLQLAETEVMPQRSKYEIQQIFSNIEQILPINKHLLEAVRQRVDTWHEGQLLGDIFLKMAPFFKMYNTYGNNYEKAIETYTRCDTDAAFAETVERIETQVKEEWPEAVSLESLLITPVQRIPRYNLLLRDLLRKTDETHPDFANLTNALEQFENVMSYLDTNITEAENMKKFLEMGTRFKGGNRLIVAHRVLITEGVIFLGRKRDGKSKEKKSIFSKDKIDIRDEKLQVWLFNDVLVHLKTSKSKSKTNVASTEYTWPLELIWIEDIAEEDTADPKLPYSFTLIGPLKQYLLKFPTLQDKHTWMGNFNGAIKKVISDENAPDENRRYGSYKFPKEGGEYTGWWHRGRIHGDGVFKFFGNKYSGEWEFSRKSGTGSFECVTGEKYIGQWVEDRPDGYGTFKYHNGDIYEGMWKNGMREGRGVHRFLTGDLYDGEWKMNVPSGEGHLSTVMGFQYKGGWELGNPHGHGVLTSPNGRIYQGEFNMGKREGEGRMNYANGDYFVGQWKCDRPHGFGVMQSIVDGVYEGFWSNGLHDGSYGTMVFKNGNFYSGGWKKGQFHGKGVFCCMDGGVVRYEGLWTQGQFNGKGKLLYATGDTFTGIFKDDKPHGVGVHAAANSVLFDGKWVEGVRHGKGTLGVGPSRWTAPTKNGIMYDKDNRSFLVSIELPTFHLIL